MQVSRQFLLTYFSQFLNKMRLIPRPGGQGVNSTWWVACSGGPDSMLLLWLLKHLPGASKRQIKVLHVNYHTSSYSEKAQQLIEKFCREQGMELVIQQAALDLSDGNFEKQARSIRYRWFFTLMGKQDLLFTGHNLTDSMEWSWMQMLKSSHPRNWIGIPIRNGRIRRPLMCLSRTQIRNLCQHFQIEFASDPSNQNLRFERNRMRHLHMSELKKDYPSLEKNYVARHNQLAIIWNKFAGSPKAPKAFQVLHPRLGGVLLLIQTPSLVTQQEKIVELIQSLSTAQRGSVRDQMQRLEQAWRNKKEGPLLFSGGVRIFLFEGALLILDQKSFVMYQQWDQDFAQLIERSGMQEIYWNCVKVNDVKNPRDFICHYDKSVASKGFAPRQKPLPLLPKTCAALKKLGVPWQSTFRYQHIREKKLNKR